MRILHILDHSIPLHSGYTFRTRNILRHQRALGWETLHVTGLKQGISSGPQEDVDGLRFYRTSAGAIPFGSVPILNQIEVVSTLTKRIFEIAKQERPDILHAHSPALNGLAALRVGQKLGLPVVYECRAFWEDAAVDHGTSREHGMRYRLTRAMETRVFRRADAITTICEGLQQEIVGRGISGHKVTVIPNAVDTESFTFGAVANPVLQEKTGLEGKTVLGFIGSFYAYEGILLLLESLPSLLEAYPELCLLLVGGGPQEAAIRECISSSGLEKSVVLTGRVPHDSVQDYYNLVDIFVYPRISMRLTELVTPLKPLEAMAQGGLVVASNVGGHRELIRDRDTGVLFRSGDRQALVEAVDHLLGTREEWPAMRARGRDFVLKQRTWAASVACYKSVYESVLRR